MDDTEKRAEQLLSELDTAAREVDHYEYGLPIYGEDRADLVEMALAAIREAVAAERERCAQVADNFAAGADAVIAAEGHSWCPQCHEYTRTVADDIAEAIREGTPAKPAPAWSKMHPMQPGWYWLRLVTYGGVTTTQAVEVDWYDDPGGKLWCDDGMIHEIQGQWLGPIEVPA